ncbi:MAG: antirestriction protein ArdA [Candidatus Neomicrothrix subdominans]
MNEHHPHSNNPERDPADEIREREPGHGLNPQIWVGSLADYNAGRLHGDWIDAAVEPEQLHAAVQRILAGSKEPVAEEWGIFDYDEFGAFKVGEYELLEVVARIARSIREHGPAFAAWAGLHDADETMCDQFEDAYLGHYDTAEDWAREALDSLNEELDQSIPDAMRGYVQIDYAGWLRDVELEGDVQIEEAEGVGCGCSVRGSCLPATEDPWVGSGQTDSNHYSNTPSAVAPTVPIASDWYAPSPSDRPFATSIWRATTSRTTPAARPSIEVSVCDMPISFLESVAPSLGALPTRVACATDIKQQTCNSQAPRAPAATRTDQVRALHHPEEVVHRHGSRASGVMALMVGQDTLRKDKCRKS